LTGRDNGAKLNSIHCDGYSVIGFYGKIPANGDFVQNGLPRSFTDAWHGWMQECLAGSRAVLGEAWTGLWMQAPIWRFRLAPNVCGPAALTGLWMPSVDRVGRYFPLMFASFSGGTMWFDAAEAIGLAALEQDLIPQMIQQGLQALPDMADRQSGARGSTWWTEGAPSVASVKREYNIMPGREQFAAMLTDADFPGRPLGR
jgi:type VI secretion system protein ImpM